MEACAAVRLGSSLLDHGYSTYFADLVRLCRALGGGPDSEDIAQEAIIYARAHADQLRDPEKLVPWLRQITRHAVSRHRRRQAAVDDLGRLVFAPHDLDGDLDLAAAIAALPQRERQVLALVYGLGYSQAEVADTLGIARGTVAATLFHARGRLARKLRGQV